MLKARSCSCLAEKTLANFPGTLLLIFHSEVSQRAWKVKLKLSRRPPGREHVCVNMNISLCTQFDEALCSLFSLAFKVCSTEAPGLTRVGTFTRSTVAGGGYFRTLHQKTGEREVRALRTCVSEVY